MKGASLRHNKCADALLKAGANVDVKTVRSGRTMLSLAIETPSFPGYRGLIWTLLHYGANPNIKDRNGDCPILQLLYGGYKPLEDHRRAALALVLEESKYAVDVNVEPPGTRNSPLHLAVRRSDPWAAGMLLAKKASLTTKNGTGHTPFASAVNAWTKNMATDQKEVTMLLLRHGVNPNEEILEGAPALKTTALHVAIRHAHLDLVEYLVRYGADPSRVDHEGRDAYAYCASRQNNGLLDATLADDIRGILTLHGARASWESDDSENDTG